MERPNPELIRRFAKVLEDAGISVSAREERGTDIGADLWSSSSTVGG